MKGLPVEYEVKVKKDEILDDVIVAAQNIEDMIVRKEIEKQKVGEKRCQANQGGSMKKSLMSTKSLREGETLTYKKCRMLYWGECKLGSKAYYKCGDPNHKSFECKNEVCDVECYLCHEKGHINKACPKRKSEVVVQNAGKKVEPNKSQSSCFSVDCR